MSDQFWLPRLTLSELKPISFRGLGLVTTGLVTTWPGS